MKIMSSGSVSSGRKPANGTVRNYLFGEKKNLEKDDGKGMDVEKSIPTIILPG